MQSRSSRDLHTENDRGSRLVLVERRRAPAWRGAELHPLHQPRTGPTPWPFQPREQIVPLQHATNGQATATITAIGTRLVDSSRTGTAEAGPRAEGARVEPPGAREVSSSANILSATCSRLLEI